MNRLFGRSTKKPSGTNPAQEQPDHPPEEDGFTVVAAEERPTATIPAISNANPYGYNTPAYPVGSSQVQAATPTKPPVHYLDGVPFVMGGGSAEYDLDTILARAEAASERLKSINWGAYEYDFSLEKTVIEQDVTATMRRQGYMFFP